jgi:DNA-binding Lrp family transcriptional regulator
MGLSEEDRNRLLRRVQHEVPLVEQPFAAIASDLGFHEDEVLAELGALRESGLLREISAVLEGSALGYDSALVACAVRPSDLARVVDVVNAHPTVTHNYLREHAYNLWFTIAVPAEMGLDATLHALARAAGVEAFHALRRTTTFKIGVNFDLASGTNQTDAQEIRAAAPIRPNERERRLFRALQTPLPLVRRPFDELACLGGDSRDELLGFARSHLGGAIRRYIGTLRHRKAGVRANGMAVWRVGESELQRIGRSLAAAPEVSHCYARNPIPGFSYTLYSMLHAQTREACLAIAARLSEQVSISDYTVLFSVEEYKKVRLRYFLPELDEWWEAHRIPRD